MFIHYLITRFNIRVSAYGPEKMDSPAMDNDWLNERLKLFLLFCSPSVVEQTIKNFTWLIYLDPETPSFVFEQLAYLKTSSVKMEFRFATDYDSMQRDIVSVLKNVPTPYIITTRLDNDDMISKHFIERVQISFKEKHNVIINFLRGYEYSYHGLVLRQWNQRPHNQFISIIEDRNDTDVQSIYGFPHWKLPHNAEVINIAGDHYWIYLRHELNYSSDKKNGIPCFIKPADLKLFPAVMQNAPLSFSATCIYALKWLRKVTMRRSKSALTDLDKGMIRRGK